MRKFFRKAAKMLMMALVFSMVGIFGVLPTNPSVSSATVGKDICCTSTPARWRYLFGRWLAGRKVLILAVQRNRLKWTTKPAAGGAAQKRA